MFWHGNCMIYYEPDQLKVKRTMFSFRRENRIKFIGEVDTNELISHLNDKMKDLFYQPKNVGELKSDFYIFGDFKIIKALRKFLELEPMVEVLKIVDEVDKYSIEFKTSLFTIIYEVDEFSQFIKFKNKDNISLLLDFYIMENCILDFSSRDTYPYFIFPDFIDSFGQSFKSIEQEKKYDFNQFEIWLCENEEFFIDDYQDYQGVILECIQDGEINSEMKVAIDLLYQIMNLIM